MIAKQKTSATVDKSEATAGPAAVTSTSKYDVSDKIKVEEDASTDEDGNVEVADPDAQTELLKKQFKSDPAVEVPEFEIIPARATDGVRTTPLNDQELKDLLECETTIDRAMQGFVDLGKAMAKIRDNKLFEPAYKSFPDYLDKRWGYTRQYAWNIINASDAYIALAERINKDKLPKSERAMRALLKAPSEKRSEVLDIAAKAGEPTTERIIEAIATVIPKKATKAGKAKRKPAIQPDSAVKAVERWADYLESCDATGVTAEERTQMTTAHNKAVEFFNKLTPAA